MADFDATRLVMSRSDESRGDYWKDRALSAEAELQFQAELVKSLLPYQERAVKAEAERDALKALLNRALEALDDEIGGYRKWPTSVGGKLLLDLDAAIDAARK